MAKLATQWGSITCESLCSITQHVLEQIQSEWPSHLDHDIARSACCLLQHGHNDLGVALCNALVHEAGEVRPHKRTRVGCGMGF